MAPSDFGFERRRERCGIENCRSRRFTRDEEGFVVCQNGHRQPDLLQHEDDDLLQPSQRRARRETEVRDAGQTTLQGREALMLYLECLQLILWKQTSWLQKNKGFSHCVSKLVRDLWTLRLETISRLLQPSESASEEIFSSQIANCAHSDLKEKKGEVGARRRPIDSVPTLQDTLGLIYLACLLLRKPLSISEMYKWVLTPGFVYIRAIDSLPSGMIRHLPLALRRAFYTTTGAPELGAVHWTTMNTAGLFQKAYDMQVPPLNHTLLLLRLIVIMALPLDVMDVVRALSRVTRFDFIMPSHRKKYYFLSQHPEMQLASLLVIAVKLLYPFDDVTRHVDSVSEVGAVSLNWDAWNAESQRSRASVNAQRSVSSHRPFLDVTEKDILGMADDQLDDYMEWFENTWVKNAATQGLSRDADFRRQLYSMFPLQQVTRDQSHDEALIVGDAEVAQLRHVKTVMSKVRMKGITQVQENVAGNDLPPRIGSLYVRFRNENEIPSRARPFFNTLASEVGLSVDLLTRIVFRAESGLHKKLHRRWDIDPMDIH